MWNAKNYPITNSHKIVSTPTHEDDLRSLAFQDMCL